MSETNPKADENKIPLPPEVVPLHIPDIPVGRLFLFLGLFFATAICIRIFYIEGPTLLTLLKQFTKSNLQVPHSLSILYDFFLYMSVACQFFPIPTLPPIAFTAKAFHPVVVAFVGALGTVIAYVIDYAILGWLFRHHRVKKVRDIHMYRKLLKFFDKYAFLTVTAAAFLPIPVDVVRLMAISRAYSYWKYLLAAFVGRFPRYLIFAYLGKELPAKWILIIFLITSLPAVAKFLSDIIKKRRKAA
jgi:membrane protein YqaA with SNARE-associated domain